jgi:hypothetical protein
MFLLRQMLAAAGVAFAVTAILCALAGFFSSRRARQAAAAAAVALGYVSGHLFTTGWTTLPPVDTTNWLPSFALASAGVGSLVEVFNSKWIRVALVGLMSCGAQRLLLQPKFRYGWSVCQGWMWVVGFGCAVVAVMICLGVIARRATRAAEPPVIFFIVCAATSGALILCGSFVLGQLAAVLAASVCGSLVFVLRRDTGADAIACVCSLLLIALLASGYFFADLPGVSMLLLAAAPACALVPNRISAPRGAAAARVAAVVAIVTIALLAVLRSCPPWS